MRCRRRFAFGKCTGYNTHRKRRRIRSVAPSERFVWAMLVLIVALIGLVAIEIVIIIFTGVVNDAVLIVVSGIIGALVSRFLEAKR
jgi:hypothetical protein